MPSYSYRCSEPTCQREFSITGVDEVDQSDLGCVYCSCEHPNLIEYDADAIDMVAEYAQKIHQLQKRVTDIEKIIFEAENEHLAPI